MSLHQTTLGNAPLNFADHQEVDDFVATLERFERGELDADAWRAYRLVAGTYGQRQSGSLSMLRAKFPQGIVSAEQLDKVAAVAARFSRGFAHITTRQNIQFHFMPLAVIGEAMTELADVGITTREACGNAVRNVTTSPTAGVAVDEPFNVVPFSRALTSHFLRHPLSASLPRKFKVSMSGSESDHSFALVNDIGFQALTERRDGRTLPGFRVTVGGGTAILCQSGRELFEFLPAESLLSVAEAIVRVFHAKGDRIHRKKNRMKFLIREIGWETFREAVLSEWSKVLALGGIPLPFDPLGDVEERPPPEANDARFDLGGLASLLENDTPQGPGIAPRHLPLAFGSLEARFRRTNTAPQKQPGYCIVTITVPLGDISSGRFRALAALSRHFSDGTLRFTHGQNLLLRWVREERVTELFHALDRIGLAQPDAESLADVSSCPGAESCKLAVTESRRLAVAINERFRSDVEALNLAQGATVKVSGCPNGCGLHHVAAIGFQGGMGKAFGRAFPQYHLYVGGDVSGREASFGRVIARVPAHRVNDALSRILSHYESHREGSETITAFLQRASLEELKGALGGVDKVTEADLDDADFVRTADEQSELSAAMAGECSA